MSEDRRAEPTEAAGVTPVQPALHDDEGTDPGVAVVEDVEIEPVPAAQVPPVEPRGAVPKAADSSPQVRRSRAKMGLRIPDDEISRPLEGRSSERPPRALSDAPAPQAGARPQDVADGKSPAPAVALQPMRIISIGEPRPTTPVPSADVRPGGAKDAARVGQERPAARLSSPELHPGTEDSWTPYQPTVADELAHLEAAAEPGGSRPAEALRAGAILRSAELPASADSRTERHALGSDDLIPIDSDAVLETASDDGLELVDEPPSAPRMPTPTPPAAAATPTAPMVLPRLSVDASPSATESKALANGSDRPPGPVVRPKESPARKENGGGDLALALSPPATVLPPVRSMQPTEPEGEEIRIEEDLEPQRVSDPGDAAEVSADDLVSVESAPAVKAPPSPPKTPAAAALKTTPTPAAAFAVPSAAPRPRLSSVPPPAPKGVASATPRPPLVIVPPHVGVAAPASGPDARRRARPWWEELFNDDFIRTMAKISDDQIAGEADFIEDSLGVARGGTMLDLACGTGRHAIELARRGYEVVGFDLSLAMLARAADEAQERDAKLNFVQGDMREMTFDEVFDGVYSWNTSFGFFEEEKNVHVVARIHRALKKGGQFLLDIQNRDFIIQHAPSLAWFEGDGCVCMDEMSIDWITSRMKVKRTMMMDDGRSKEIEYSIRIYSLHELGKILHDVGFRVCEVSGRAATPGVYFGAESPRTLILAEKR